MTNDNRLNFELEPQKNDLADFNDLLLDPFGNGGTLETVGQPPAKVTVQEQKLFERLTPEYQEKAKHIAQQIDHQNPQAIMQYGITAQSELSKFSGSMLGHVQTKDTGPIGDVISELMAKIGEVNPDEFDTKQGLFSKMFGSIKKTVQQTLSKYQKINVEIDRIADKLDKTRHVLIKDVQMLEVLFKKNKEYFDVLNIYIAAAEMKIDQLEREVLPGLRKKAEESDDQMVVQEVNDMQQFINRLEKRIHDLKLSRQIAIQSAPQIRMIQQINQALVEKIQSSILTTIPLWKNQIVIALTLFRQKRATETQKQVTKTTNDLLVRNSEMLKINSIEAAKENERGIVDIETLKKTQENLMTTLDEVLKIQQEGKAKRQAAERELVVMEEQLKNKLLTTINR